MHWAKIYDPADTDLISLPSSGATLCNSSISPSAQWVATISCGGQLQILDTKSRHYVPITIAFKPAQIHWSDDDALIAMDRAENQAVVDAVSLRELDLTVIPQAGGRVLDVKRVQNHVQALVGFGPRYRGVIIIDLITGQVNQIDSSPAVFGGYGRTSSEFTLGVYRSPDVVVQQWSGDRLSGGSEPESGVTMFRRSPQGTLAALAHTDGSLSFIDLTSFAAINPPSLSSAPISSLAVTAAATFLSGNADGEIHIWNAGTGKVTRAIQAPCYPARATASIGGHFFALGCVYPQPRLRIVPSDGERSARIVVIPTQPDEILDGIADISVSYDGQHSAWVQESLSTKTARVEGRAAPLCTSKTLARVLFSSSGRYLAAGCVEGGLRIFDTQRNTVISESDDNAIPSAFGSGDRTLVCGNLFGLDVRDIDTLQTISTVEWEPYPKLASTSPRDHRLIVSSGTSRIGVFGFDGNRLAHVRDLDAGVPVTALAISLTNAFLVGANDGTIQLWRTDYKLTLRLAATVSGLWLAVAPDGAFEGSADAVNWLAFHAPGTPLLVGADVLFNDYFTPGLLENAWVGLPSAALRAPRTVTAAQIAGWELLKEHGAAHVIHTANSTTVCLAFSPQGLKVYADGSPFNWAAQDFEHSESDPTCRYRKDLPPGQQIDLESDVRAFQLEKPDHALPDYPGDGDKLQARPRRTYVAVVGVGAYDVARNGLLSISATKGARLVYDSFARMAAKPENAGHFVLLHPLFDQDATRNAILDGLEELAKRATESDAVVIYLSGHGLVPAGQGLFYFIPYDGNSDSLASLRQTAISSAHLTEALMALRAKQVFVVVDACQSGSALQGLITVAKAKADYEQEFFYSARQGRPADAAQHFVALHFFASAMPLQAASMPEAGPSATARAFVQQFSSQGSEPIWVDSQTIDYFRQRVERDGKGQLPLVRSFGYGFQF